MRQTEGMSKTIRYNFYMVIREATQKDIFALAKLAQETYRATFSYTMTNNELTKALKTRSEAYFQSVLNVDVILVAEDERMLVGFIQFGTVTIESVEATNQDIELNKIYIDVNHQGKGIGKKLIDEMFSHSRLEDIKNVYLDVFDKNEKAVSLYKKYGFKIIGTIPFVVDGEIVGHDLLMRCSIK